MYSWFVNRHMTHYPNLLRHTRVPHTYPQHTHDDTMHALSARTSAFASSRATLAMKKTTTAKTGKTAGRGGVVRVDAVAVEIRHEGQTYNLEVADGDNILDVALDAGIDVRYDCKMGVCMMCPAKVVSGELDQSGSMLSDDVEEKGYALLCCAKPLGDVVIQTVTEDELLDEQLCSSG